MSKENVIDETLDEVVDEVVDEVEQQKGIPPFQELRKVDLSEYTKKRDGADYVNWAVIKQLLHDFGSEKVYFEPVAQNNGSSLIMTDKVFIDRDKRTNQVYETRIKVIIDDLEFEIQGPVMNGSNPVKDNSMSQQRLWNSQTRLFVKGVAIHTGLGFDLWSRIERAEDEENIEENLYIHNLFKIKERIQEIYIEKMKSGLTTKDIAQHLNKTEDEVKAIFSYFDIINSFERDLHNLDINE